MLWGSRAEKMRCSWPPPAAGWWVQHLHSHSSMQGQQAMTGKVGEIF